MFPLQAFDVTQVRISADQVRLQKQLQFASRREVGTRLLSASVIVLMGLLTSVSFPRIETHRQGKEFSSLIVHLRKSVFPDAAGKFGSCLVESDA